MSRTYKYLTALIAVIALTPVLLAVNDLFDGEVHSMFFFTQDKDYLHEILTHGWYVMYAIFLGVNKLWLATGFLPKFFFNVLGAVSILGTAREVYVYLRERFGFSAETALLGAWGVLVFPEWHVLMSSVFSSHIFCIWLFMISVNLWRRNRLLALPFFLVSLNLFSLFSLAIGFACVEFLMSVDRDSFWKKGVQLVVFSAVLLGLYLAVTSFINVHGDEGTYNTLNLNRVQSFVNFGIMACVLLGAWFVLSRRSRDKAGGERALRLILSFLALAFFAGFAYWAVGRPLRFFAFGSFTARHTFLSCIPFGLFLAVGAELLARRWGARIMRCAAAFAVASCLVLLYQGYDHKAAELLFKDMFVDALQRIEPPASGYVSLVPEGYIPPRHLHAYSLNMCFFRAYKRAAWMSSGFYLQRGHIYTAEDLREQYGAPGTQSKLTLAFEATGDRFTQYAFSLDNYHQEGRTWYWCNYLAKDYAFFHPRLTRTDALE